MEHLPGAPLQLALAQVRFAPVYAVEQPGLVADFQKCLGSRYTAQQAPDPDGGRAESTWLFRDNERGWTVSVTPSSLGLDAGTYLDFDDFAGEFSRVLRDLESIFEPQLEVRLGVRYINRVEDDRLSKRGIGFFVNEQLAGPVGGELGGELEHSLSEMRFREGGGWIAIRHGLIKPDTYLLDFDRFAEDERNFVPSEIVKRVKRFHSLIERLFVWSLSERYLKELKGAK